MVKKLKSLIYLCISTLIACSTPPPITEPSATIAPTILPVLPSFTPIATPLPPELPPSQTVPPSTPLPTPTATPRPVVISGTVYEDNQAILKDVTISLHSLTETITLEQSIVSPDGQFQFLEIPTGINVELTASKSGHTRRKQVFVTADNRTLAFTLSNQPEVIAASPDKNAEGVQPNTSFQLTFSEPMDPDSVRENLTIRSFSSVTLSVDKDAGSTFTGSPKGAIIWLGEDFDFKWSPFQDQVMLTFKPGRQLPTDKDMANIPLYQVSFTPEKKTGMIADKNGTQRQQDFFKLTDGEAEDSYTFSILPDGQAPSLSSLQPILDESKNQKEDQLQVTFSEPMVLFTQTQIIAGGMADRNNLPNTEKQAPAAYPEVVFHATPNQTAANYTVEITRQNKSTPWYIGNWGYLGGSANYDSTDIHHKTVLLSLPHNRTGQDLSYFVPVGKTAQTTTVGTLIQRDAIDNSTWKWGWQYLQADGMLSVHQLTEDIEDASSPSSAFHLATALQKELNLPRHTTELNPPTSSSPWRVQASADNRSLLVTLNDTSGNHIGWQLIGGIYQLEGSDQLPLGVLIDGTMDFKNDSALDVFEPNDTIKVTVSDTVTDPAGNPINQQKNTVSAIAQK